jgi:uncharacterized membrane protein
VLLVTDIVWLNTSLFDQPNLSAVAAFYLIFVVGIIVLCFYPALRVGNRRIAFLNGAVLVLAAYDPTNLATLRGWHAGFTARAVYSLAHGLA